MAKKTIFILIICVMCANAGFSRLIINITEIAFNSDSTPTPPDQNPFGVNSSSQSIKNLIMLSAGYFLKGQSDIYNLSEKAESADIRGFDSYSARSDLDRALYNVYYSLYYYRLLAYKSTATPYNQSIIDKLTAFNYDDFCLNNDLVKDIFEDVKTYLEKGDVRGVYFRIEENMVKIYSLLQNAKSAVDKGQVPDNSTLWNLNQECSKTLLFGQYVTRVFEAIRQE